MLKAKKGGKGWILPGLLGVFLLHPLSAELHQSQMEAPPPAPPATPIEAPPPSPPSKPPTNHRREEKIFQILSKYVTGLSEEQEMKLAAFIGQESRRYGFDPELIVAVISTESSFYNWSESSKGALGLMQIIPATGREVAEVNDIAWRGDDRTLFDPFLNIKLGIHYLYTLHLKFGNIQLALTAYNYGPGKVFRWLKEGEEIPKKYADKVLAYYDDFMKFDHGHPVKEPKIPDPKDPFKPVPDLQTASRS